MAQRRSQTTAVVSIIQLKSCLVNLPSGLANILDSVNTAPQNIVIELQHRVSPSGKKTSSTDLSQQSIYVGWTGMISQRRASAASLSNGRPGSRDRDAGFVEIDSSFARIVGLSEGQKVGVLLHADPPAAHTVNIEPLTPEDWEIIELHATFLETNLIAQVRALPNPSFSGAVGSHPLTIHLSPTSTANITVTALAPPPASKIPFAKLDPDAEVIVAPKSRVKQSLADRRGTKSVTGASQKSLGGHSVTNHRAHRAEGMRRPVFLRGVASHMIVGGVGGSIEIEADGSLQIWLDVAILSTKNLRGTEYACVSLVQPVGAQPSIDPQQLQKLRDQEIGEIGKHAPKVVARLKRWDNAVDTRHALLSHSLCSALGADGIVGGVVRVEAAPPAISASEVQSLKVYPISSTYQQQKESIRFGGETRASREAAAEKLRAIFGSKEGNGLLGGALTDGMILACSSGSISAGWHGGLLRFQPPSQESSKAETRWIADVEGRYIDVQQDIMDPFELSKNSLGQDDRLLKKFTALVGVDSLATQAMSHLLHRSCLLLCGGLGSGKTSIAHLLAYRLQRKHLFYTSFVDCRKLVTEETRVATVKDTIEKLFLKASWGCKLGGQSLIVLDNLDKLCPADTELQVGGEARNRQISEIFVSTVRQFCSFDSGIVLLATSRSKDELHAVIISGHVFRETVEIKAPDKDKRRRILESLTWLSKTVGSNASKKESTVFGSKPGSRSSSCGAAGWLDSPASGSCAGLPGQDGIQMSLSMDFLKIAGQTDGYMPEDLVLLCSRARSEALVRSVSKQESTSGIELREEDFENALNGFTPASLRNVTLQSSSTKFESIGGLKETRKILLETLQYPTTYAPIFAQCPLRLRSGILLYGFPGCGKTLLASAVAGECGLNFISVKGPEILNKYIGASEKSVRDLFQRAEAARPCVLFFDEFDSIAPKRGHDSTGVTDRVVNQLLTQMDGAEGLSGVYVLAATSRPDLIDPALLRPGRLDKSLLCDMPSEEDRLDILKALSKELKINHNILADIVSSGKNLKEIARRTEGYSGADLQAVVYNAHLEAIHDVLGDSRNMVTEVNGSRNTNMPPGRGLLQQEFMQFRYSEEEDQKALSERAASGFNRAQQLNERATLAAKIEALKLARRKEKAQKRNVIENGIPRARNQENGQLESEIQWKHLEASLQTTRSSISPAERQKLENIYREFVTGRNGEMPSGQGPMEIGARSSLA